MAYQLIRFRLQVGPESEASVEFSLPQLEQPLEVLEDLHGGGRQRLGQGCRGRASEERVVLLSCEEKVGGGREGRRVGQKVRRLHGRHEARRERRQRRRQRHRSLVVLLLLLLLLMVVMVLTENIFGRLLTHLLLLLLRGPRHRVGAGVEAAVVAAVAGPHEIRVHVGPSTDLLQRDVIFIGLFRLSILEDSSSNPAKLFSLLMIHCRSSASLLFLHYPNAKVARLKFESLYVNMAQQLNINVS